MSSWSVNCLVMPSGTKVADSKNASCSRGPTGVSSVQRRRGQTVLQQAQAYGTALAVISPIFHAAAQWLGSAWDYKRFASGFPMNWAY